MAIVFCLALLCMAVAQAVDFSVECGEDSLTARWPNQPNIEPSLLQLGYCDPTSVSVISGVAQVVFEFKEWRCGAEMMALKDRLVWSTELTHPDPPVVRQTVVCEYQRPDGWTPQIFRPVFETHGTGQLNFDMTTRNADFSGPAVTKRYNLGSRIPISASVNQQDHQPLLLLLEECKAYPEPEMGPDTLNHAFITNKGCFSDSRKTSSSTFLPRHRSSEIRLYLQAFAFPRDNYAVYIRCKLVAWGEDGFNAGKKACHETNGSWELLDDSAQSALCSCCDYSGDNGCQSRRRRRGLGGKGMARNVVVGPRVIEK